MAPTQQHNLAPGAPSFVEHNVEHYRQRYDWDCGFSCVMMLLSEEERKKVIASFTQICSEEGFEQSTWTIDLCYLLKRFNIDHCMYTIRLGVNEDYKKKRYYDKIIDKDRARVSERFASADSAGVRCVQRALSSAELVQHVASSGPALLLVHEGLLRCRHCRTNRLFTEFRRCLGGVEFTGHYILVVGYQEGGRRVLYRDPSRSGGGRARGGGVCSTRLVDLQRARSAVGTDYDVILIYRDYT